MPKFFTRIVFAIVAIIGFTTAGFASNVWEGVFTSASQSGAIWTASVFDHESGRQLTKQFEECRRVVQPIHGWACHREVMNFVFADSQNFDNLSDQGGSSDFSLTITTTDQGAQSSANHLVTQGRPTDADLASKPDGWGGIYKFADKHGNSWTAMRYDGVSEGPFGACTTFNKKVICQ